MNSKIHFIGICGAGMSAVAIMMAENGWQVTGSDEGFYPPVSTNLLESKIKFKKGYNPKNIPPDTEIIVIGKHAGLTPEKNKEVKAAFESGKTIRSFPEILAKLGEDKTRVVIAGSYGKSTCSALLTWCLKKSGLDPSWFIGAVPSTPVQSSHLGKGKLFVLEGDEYPSSNWDNSSKFLHYNPEHILITSLAHDHLNVFPTVTSYKSPFKKLIKHLDTNGTLTACLDGAGIKEFLKLSRSKKITYSSDNPKADWEARNVRYGSKTTFDLYRKNKKIAVIKSSLLGKHNVENITGIGAMAIENRWVMPGQFEKAIASFKPLARRLDRLSNNNGSPVYEGFGSSLEKTLAAVQALRLHYPDRKLIVLFEPYALSWRDQKSLPWYKKAFNDADKVYIFTSSSYTPSREQVRSARAEVFSSGTELKNMLRREKGNNVILILSSGGFGGIIDKIFK